MGWRRKQVSSWPVRWVKYQDPVWHQVFLPGSISRFHGQPQVHRSQGLCCCFPTPSPRLNFLEVVLLLTTSNCKRMSWLSQLTFPAELGDLSRLPLAQAHEFLQLCCWSWIPVRAYLCTLCTCMGGTGLGAEHFKQFWTLITGFVHYHSLSVHLNLTFCKGLWLLDSSPVGWFSCCFFTGRTSRLKTHSQLLLSLNVDTCVCCVKILNEAVVLP